jgi:peptidoglycan/LPS O-acetylase OafA/YrhL
MEHTLQATKKLHFGTLDSWRGLCAILVALLHFPIYWHLYFWPFFRSSYLFVDFFFVLSGFVIAYNYTNSLQKTPIREGIPAFVIRRFGRLWPLHAALLLALILREVAKAIVTARYGQMGPVAPFTGSSAPNTIVLNALLLHAMGLTAGPSWNGPSWSIGAEFYTYLVFALVCVTARRYSTWVYAAIAVVAAIAIFRYSPPLMDTADQMGFVRCLYGFSVGCIVYVIFTATRDLAWRWIKLATAIEVMVVALCIAFVSVAGHDPIAMIAPLVFALSVYVFAFEAGAISRILLLPRIMTIGALSYSIYMVHWLVSLILTGIPKAITSKTSINMFTTVKGDEYVFYKSLYLMDLYVLFYVAVLIGLAMLTFRFIENPGRRFFNGLAKRWYPGAV